jgi:hypothetical protein
VTDKPKLTPANENPWYVLMTLHGEQDGEEFSAERHRENRETWNTLLQHGYGSMSERAREAQLRLPSQDKWRNEYKSINERWLSAYQNRNNGADLPIEFDYRNWPCDLSDCKFDHPLFLYGFFLPKGAIFDRSHLAAGLTANSTFFGGRLSLIESKVDGDVSCERAHFEDGLNFQGAVISGNLSLAEAKISGDVKAASLSVQQGLKLTSVKIDGPIEAHDLAVGGDATFEAMNCKEDASFRDATFNKKASFTSSTFGSDLGFDGTVVDGRLSFLKATVEGVASFKGRSGFQKERPAAHFGTKTVFSEAHFKGRADFYLRRFGPPKDTAQRATVLTFANAVFEAPVSFEKAEFPYLMPVLSNTTLPASTRLTAKPIYWPPIHIGWRQGRTDHEQVAEKAKESAATFRHVMNQQSLPEEEHFFFSREMHHAGRIGGWFQRLPYRLFGWLSAYGGSIERPALGLWWLFLAPLGVYLAALGPIKLATFGKAIGLSFSSIFKFFGLQRTYFGAENIQNMHEIVQVLTATQTVLSFILLFFLGLGLRTRFRLR